MWDTRKPFRKTVYSNYVYIKKGVQASHVAHTYNPRIWDDREFEGI